MHNLSADIVTRLIKSGLPIRKVPCAHLQKSMMWMKKMIRQIADSENTPYLLANATKNLS